MLDLNTNPPEQLHRMTVSVKQVRQNYVDKFSNLNLKKSKISNVTMGISLIPAMQHWTVVNEK